MDETALGTPARATTPIDHPGTKDAGLFKVKPPSSTDGQERLREAGCPRSNPG
ncbi:hypothetical protein NE857_25930 [Nocardiopsis exhalans]|uniref:Uncharacterized protein n=2 Tax=Nocardiopsis TaxID=2013 RepID=A0A840WA33_9ACTN|nr:MULTISPECIES: hypothetical protein [Nocardiopsis]MBB5492233.1 hypothetical protein [Nocardiopsis metallicus]USY18699.1 hypothetical protein NE857_25930 [Nocardiopsis exhalans]